MTAREISFSSTSVRLLLLTILYYIKMRKQCQIKLAFSPVFLAEFINLCIIIRDNDIIKAVSYTTASMVKGGYT